MIREIVINDFGGWCSAMGDLCPVICCHALAILKEQESIIKSLKADLSETLDIVTNRKNVIRCKDCIHWTNAQLCGYRVCDKHTKPQVFATKGEWYCADGQRKEG